MTPKKVLPKQVIKVHLTELNLEFAKNYESQGFDSMSDLVNTAIRQLRNAKKSKEMAVKRLAAYDSLEGTQSEFAWESIDKEPFLDC